MIFSDDTRVKHTRSGIERIHSGINSQLSNGTGKHSGGVQVSEGGSRGRIGQIVSRNVDSLNGGDGTLAVGGDTLLQSTQIRSKSGLVTNSRWNTSKQGRNLGVGLSETEDVVNEKKHVLSLLITEVLRNSETGKSNTGSGTWRLIHLSVNESGLGSGAIELDHTRLNHLVVQIVAFTGAFSNTGEHGVTTVSLSDVVDELHDKHSLADTSSSEQANLSSLGIWGKKVDDLDAGNKNLSLSRLLRKGRGVCVDRLSGLGNDRTTLINRLSDHIDDTAEKLGASRNHNRVSSVNDRLTTDETFGGVHSNRTHGVLTKMLGDLKNEANVVILNLQGIEDSWELLGVGKLNVNDGTDNLPDLAYTELGGGLLRHGSDTSSLAP
mmetsp:Transcript_15998/g.53610  ORF Transcript_15998/g.53610 Transcript_15998/m.53610 type:complete len:380 (-) Transcript_15998:156-1295(-)